MYIPGLQPLAYASAMAAASAVGTTEELLRSQREDKLAGKEDPFTRVSKNKNKSPRFIFFYKSGFDV